MKSKISTLLIVTLTSLSFSSIAKAETAPKSTINSPAYTAVVEDKSQQTAENYHNLPQLLKARLSQKLPIEIKIAIKLKNL